LKSILGSGRQTSKPTDGKNDEPHDEGDKLDVTRWT